MLRRKKLAKYRDCLQYLLEKLLADGEFSLAQCREEINREPDKMQQLIPDVDIFKEIMVELIKSREIDIPALKKNAASFCRKHREAFSCMKCCWSFWKPRSRKPEKESARFR